MLGTDLVKALASNCDVLGIDTRRSTEEWIPTALIDLGDRLAVQAVFEQFKPDVVFHLAAMTNVDGCEKDRSLAYRMNVETTKNVVDSANLSGTFVVGFSTDYVFDGRKGAEYGEGDVPHPLNYYGETKLHAEEYIQNFAKHYTLFRISWLFGRAGMSFPRTILEKAGHVNYFEVVSDQIGRPTHTQDLADALKRVFLKEKNDTILDRQIFHLGNSGSVSWADYAEFILKCSGGPKPEVRKILTPPNHRPAERPKDSVLSLDKSKRLLGIQMRSWEKAVEEFVHDYENSKR